MPPGGRMATLPGPLVASVRVTEGGVPLVVLRKNHGPALRKRPPIWGLTCRA